MIKRNKFGFAMLVVVAAFALSLLHEMSEAQPITRPGLTKVTHDGTMLGSGTTPSPLGLALCGSNAVWVMNGSGTGWGCSGPLSLGSAGATSLSVSVGTTTGTIALDTLGTTDWMYYTVYDASAGALVVAGSQPPGGCGNSTGSKCNTKLNGGAILIAAGLQWVGSWTSSPSTTTSSITFTGSAADNLTGAAMSSTSYACGATSSASTNPGFRINLPSAGNGVQRVARIYTFQYDNAMTCTATTTDASASGSSATNNTGSGGVATTNTWTITYRTYQASPVQFVCRLTTINTGAGTPALCWGAVTLSPT